MLLPAGWRGWSPADRDAVLAHELSHVAAGDFGRNLLAQSLLLAQFYHPLAHWLAGRVRADQELAADAAAAGLCGGRQPYLRSLAAVALSADPGPRRRGLSRLSLSSEPALWPARAFLPTRRTLHERVEMLRKPPVPLSRRTKLAGPLAVAGVLCVAAVASGFRPEPNPDPPPVAPGPTDPQDLFAGSQPEGSAFAGADADDANAAVPDLLAYVPADAEFVFTANVKSLMTAPALAPIVAALRGERGPEGELLRAAFGVGFGDLERVVIFADRLAGDEASAVPPPAFLLRTVGEAPEQAAELPDGTPLDPATSPVRRVDARTLAFRPGGPAPGRPAAPMNGAPALPRGREMLASAAHFAADSDGGDVADELAGAELAVFADVTAARESLLGIIDWDPEGNSSPLALLRPYRAVLQGTDAAAVALKLTGDGSVKLSALFQAPAGTAPALEGAVRGLLPRLRDDMIRLRGAAAAMPVQAGGPALAAVADAARRALDDPSVAAGGDRVRVNLAAEESASLVAALLMPAMSQARIAAERDHSQSKLKQIGLALHNYHSTYKHFPPAVIVENGVKRSWRVEILPFLGETGLYDDYRKDQPWDSQANKKVLAKMPMQYRHPADDRGGNYTAYFAVVAENAGKSSGRYGGPTAWLPEGKPTEGFGFADVRDGTVSTILAVESKRPVPWTKPEDITYDAAADLMPQGSPKEPTTAWRDGLGLGGFTPGLFQAATVDGFVRPITLAVDPGVLRALFTRRGGEVTDDLDEATRPDAAQ